MMHKRVKQGCLLAGLLCVVMGTCAMDSSPSAFVPLRRDMRPRSVPPVLDGESVAVPAPEEQYYVWPAQVVLDDGQEEPSRRQRVYPDVLYPPVPSYDYSSRESDDDCCGSLERVFCMVCCLPCCLLGGCIRPPR